MPDKLSHDSHAEGAFENIEPGAVPPVDPIVLARRDLQKTWPKRFYKAAHAEERDGAFALLLDGRPARTPGGNRLALPTLAAAEALAAEWAAQVEVLDPNEMPLTRIVNSAIDGVALEIEATARAICDYAGTDLVCYRAGEPEKLVRAQAAAWDKVLDFARERLGARFICSEGVMFVEQPEPAREALRNAVQSFAERAPKAPFLLAALHVMTTLTGSALLALAVVCQEMTAEEAWAAAHVDEDFQIEIWGADEEAMARRAKRWREMEAAAHLWQLIS
jgi:chaperone required for assembly of F1-ATPase